MSRPSHANDPDGFFIESNHLNPDPVLLGLRSVLALRPIGAFFRWIDHRIEAREERRYGKAIDDAHSPDQSPDRDASAPDRGLAA